MKPYQLLELIAKGESQNLDFKKTITHQWKIAKTLVAFANTKGGKLLVGVMDDQSVIGIDPEEESYSLGEAAKHFCKPEIDLDFNTIEDPDGLLVLVVSVRESDQKPHYALGRNDNWNVYVRMKDKSILADKESIKKMRQGIRAQSLPKENKQTQQLWRYLEDHEKITVKEFAKLVNVSPRRARRILTELSVRGFLFSHELERETNYFLS